MDELLIKEWISNFIEDILKSKYELKFTDIKIKQTNKHIYIKFIDLLRPDICLVKNEYWFNSCIVFSDTVQHYYSFTTKDAFYNYLISTLNNNKEYLKYLQRLNYESLYTN